MNGFTWPVRVYYEDTDAGGVVYHANYLRFMERARTEWLRACGYGQDALRREQGLLFVVHGLSLQFRAPARFDDRLTVVSSLLEARGSRCTFQQDIHRDDDAATLCEGQVTVVCIDAERFRPRPMPAALRRELQHAR